MIVIFGSLNIDIVMPVGNFAKPGETVLCTTDYLSRPGGKGSNQAVAAARAGAKVAFVGKVGDDAFGRRSVNNLKNYSIWATGVGTSERPTGCATIAVDMTGANFVMVAPGANLDATADQVPDEVFTQKNIFLAQMEVTPKETYAALYRAYKKGTVTILNASPAANIPEEVLSYCHYLIVNELEAQQVAKGLGITETDPKKLALKLSMKGNNACIITLEDKGSVAARAGQLYEIPTLKIEPVDTTGAGDVFCGIFAACLQNGLNWLLALHRASIGASLSCLGLGAQSATPSMEDIEAHLGETREPHKVA